MGNRGTQKYTQASMGSGGVAAPQMTSQQTNQQTQQATQNIQNQVPNDTNTPVSSGVSSLTSMSDDQLYKLYRDSQKAILPNQLADKKSETQQFIFQAGLNAKPLVLDRQQFDQFLRDNNIPQSYILSRTVGAGNYRNQMNTNVNITPDVIANMLKNSRFNYIGGKFGGQVYGGGTYLAVTGSIGQSTGYGSGKTVTLSGVLNPATAKVISKSDLRAKIPSFAASHPKFAAAVGRPSDSNYSIYATAMGYNVITSDHSGTSKRSYNEYVNVIDRSAVVYLK